MTITLPEHLAQRGGSVDLVAGEYLDAVKRHILAHPRSQQAAIGPSEVGNPCGKEIAAKLLGHPDRDRGAPWKPTIGTAVHAWLESAFDADNLRVEAVDQGGAERWYIETRVEVGEYDGGKTITGSCDLYDRVTATVIDHKVVGPKQLKKYKAGDPGAQYRAQAHLYGRGWVRAGLPVDNVAVMFLPRDGELRDAYMWHEPYNEQVAIDALARLDGIALAVNTIGDGAIGAVQCNASPCYYCPRPAGNSFSDLVA